MKVYYGSFADYSRRCIWAMLRGAVLSLSAAAQAHSCAPRGGVIVTQPRHCAARTGEIVIRLEVDDALPGGLAIYGAKFGRYPVDPTVVFLLR